MKKTRHNGDCAIYASLVNERPEDGICTCGYGVQCMREGNDSEMYSKELEEKLKNEQGLVEIARTK